MNNSTNQLLSEAENGNRDAVNLLLERHRSRLRRMISVRMEPALRARVDESDVLQETMVEAARKLPAYLAARPIPFYAWLRSIAWEKLIDLRRAHVSAQKRSVIREVANVTDLPDHSAMHLANCLIASGTSPSLRLVKKEILVRVRSALDGLTTDHREVLVLKYLERLETRQIAAVLQISENASCSDLGAIRHRRIWLV